MTAYGTTSFPGPLLNSPAPLVQNGAMQVPQGFSADQGGPTCQRVFLRPSQWRVRNVCQQAVPTVVQQQVQEVQNIPQQSVQWVPQTRVTYRPRIVWDPVQQQTLVPVVQQYTVQQVINRLQPAIQYRLQQTESESVVPAEYSLE
jgi:hypothetical protein